MAVKDRTDAKSIDWLLQAAGTEKGKNFRIFSLQRGADWRVMQDRHSPICLQFNKRLLEANGVINRFLYDPNQFSSSMFMVHPPPKTAAESRDASEADSADFNGLAIQHVNASAIENFANKLGLSGFEIMVSEDCKHRNF